MSAGVALYVLVLGVGMIFGAVFTIVFCCLGAASWADQEQGEGEGR